MKFKVGDIVKIVVEYMNAFNKIGIITEILEDNGYASMYRIRTLNCNEAYVEIWPWYEYELEGMTRDEAMVEMI